ncbi:hypothetical protein RN001_011661 [Aquatica leii]|uniref:Gag-like protein n=1 Tax=Aquatica leii TaxID=1421715 RepID=A0AAN7PS23_9COLE|nr:hypothetical protein RN001_011661 [Aquatica leii]
MELNAPYNELNNINSNRINLSYNLNQSVDVSVPNQTVLNLVKESIGDNYKNKNHDYQTCKSTIKHNNEYQLTAETINLLNMEVQSVFKPKKRRIADVSNPFVSHPIMKRATHANESVDTTVTNRFENLLMETEFTFGDDAEKDDIENEQTTSNTEKTNRKSKTLPPIIIHNEIVDHKELTSYLKKTIKNTFQIKYAKNKTNIFTEDLDDWTALNKVLQKDNVEYHTYTPNTLKTHAFVVRGLDHCPEIDEIKEELITTHKIKTKEIYKMRGTRRPAYLVVTDYETTLKHLQQNVRALNHVRIEWERHINTKRITQCHRCQAWGHATSNCFAAPNCVKCGDEHWTRECKKDITTPPKCVNCGEEHTANNTTCQVYVKIIQQMDDRVEKNVKQHQRWAPAPIPTENPWEKRKQQQQQHAVNPTTTQQKPPSENDHAQTLPVSTTDFNELTNEIKKLNTYIDIKKLLEQVKKLNQKLAQCTSNKDKTITFLTFINELDD